MTDNIPMLRTSERAAAQRCLWMWWQICVEGLVKKGAPQTHFWFGTGVHLALALWYCGPGKKRGPHPAETWEKYAGQELQFIKQKRDLEDGTEQQFVDAKELGIAMLNGYIEKYGKDEHMYIIQPEQTFSLDIPWPKDRHDAFKFIERAVLTRYVGTYDLVFRDLRRDWLVLGEHKTAATVRTGHLTLDNQAGSYWVMAYRTLLAQDLIRKGDRLRGIEYNFLRKALPDDRPQDAEGYYCNKPLKADYIEAFANSTMDPKQLAHWKISGKMKLDDLKMYADLAGLQVLGARSKVQPPPLFERHMIHRTTSERRSQLLRIQDEALHIEAVKSGILPVTKTPTWNCSWSCPVFEMCELDEQGGDWETLRDLQYRKTDWYAAHQTKSTEDTF